MKYTLLDPNHGCPRFLDNYVPPIYEWCHMNDDGFSMSSPHVFDTLEEAIIARDGSVLTKPKVVEIRPLYVTYMIERKIS